MLPPPLRYPFRGERALDTLLVGGGAHLLSVYLPVVPLVVVLGYLLVVFEETATRPPGDRFDALPPFADVRRLVQTGLGGTAVVVAFLLPPTVTLLVTVAGLSELGLSPENLTMGTSLGFFAGSTASVLLAVAFCYVLPAALANYVAVGRVRAAFDVDVLLAAASDAAYFYNVCAGLVAGGLLLVLARALTGIAVGFFVAFYAELVAVAFWSRGVGHVFPDRDAA